MPPESVPLHARAGDDALHSHAHRAGDEEAEAQPRRPSHACRSRARTHACTAPHMYFMHSTRSLADRAGDDVDKAFEEAEAAPSAKELADLQSRMLEAVFEVYFRRVCNLQPGQIYTVFISVYTVFVSEFIVYRVCSVYYKDI
jgi:hypothetical protein